MILVPLTFANASLSPHSHGTPKECQSAFTSTFNAIATSKLSRFVSRETAWSVEHHYLSRGA
jgi:hypothetical protein